MEDSPGVGQRVFQFLDPCRVLTAYRLSDLFDTAHPAGSGILRTSLRDRGWLVAAHRIYRDDRRYRAPSISDHRDLAGDRSQPHDLGQSRPRLKQRQFDATARERDGGFCHGFMVTWGYDIFRGGHRDVVVTELGGAFPLGNAMVATGLRSPFGKC